VLSGPVNVLLVGVLELCRDVDFLKTSRRTRRDSSNLLRRLG
jgi:hypothetical protein